MPPTEQRMLHSDAFAWYMEQDPVLRSTVVAVVRLDRSPDWSRLRARIDRLTRLVPRLRMRVQVPPLRIGPPLWTVDEGFDLDFHLRRARLPEGADWDDVLEFARTCAMDDFDRSRPLWEFTVLDGLDDGGAAFVTKLHHSLSDGIGGMQLSALVIDPGPDEAPLGPLPEEPSGHGVSPVALALHTLAGDGRDALTASERVLTAAPRGLGYAIRHPLGAARATAATGVSVARFVAPINRAQSTVFGPRRTRRVLATLQVPLADLYEAATLAGCHLNDAYIAALTEGVRRYHEARGQALDEIRVTMPVSLRRSGDDIGGNRLTLTRIRIPAAVGDPVERMREIAKVVRQWRHEPALDHAQEIAFGLNLLPRAYLGGIFKRVELLASDVPGMPREVWLAGARITEYYGFGPTIGAGVNATLMSYAGTCYIGVNVDTGAVDEPQAMIACLREGLAEVMAPGRAARAASAERPSPEGLDTLAEPVRGGSDSSTHDLTDDDRRHRDRRRDVEVIADV